jgi:hypothetical protein
VLNLRAAQDGDTALFVPAHLATEELLTTRYRKKLVTPARLERATPSLEGWCSIRLSYGAMRRFATRFAASALNPNLLFVLPFSERELRLRRQMLYPLSYGTAWALASDRPFAPPCAPTDGN